jgi:dTDP-4-dehydrorhamnose 3,5-epimerase
MKLAPLGIDGAWFAESRVWSDERGFFREWFKSDEVKNLIGRDFPVEQANISLSSAATLRGIHYSIALRGQAKWITCVSGSIQDVIVDIRPNSPTFRSWHGVNLSSNNRKMLYIPEGFAHGFQTLEDNTEVFYQMSDFYHGESARGLKWDDPDVGIDWILKDNLIISERDQVYPSIKEINL